MEKPYITDTRWLGDAIGNSYFLVVVSVVLFVFLDSIRPIPNNPASLIAYGAFVLPLAGALFLILRSGFTYRRTEWDQQGLVLDEGFWGVFWHRRAINKSGIIAVERYEELRKGGFTSAWVSGIRVRLASGA